LQQEERDNECYRAPSQSNEYGEASQTFHRILLRYLYPVASRNESIKFSFAVTLPSV
jgi:hypothetical protein